MKIIRLTMVTLIILVILFSTFPLTSNIVSSKILLNSTRSQSLFFNVTTLSNKLVNDSVQTLSFDEQNNRLYVGTMNGVSIIEMDDFSVTNLTSGDGLVGNNVHSFAIDHSRQLVFIGLSGGYGINSYNWSTREVSSFYPDNSPNVLFTEALIYNQESDCLYIGTDTGGLFIQNLTTNTTLARNYTHGLPSNQIFSMELDKERETLYIGTLAGLAIYNIKNDTFDVKTNIDGLAENHVFNMEFDSTSQILYLGVWDPKLSVYDIKNNAFTNYDTGEPIGFGEVILDSVNNLLFINGVDNLIAFDTINNTFVYSFNQTNGLPASIKSLVWDSINNNLYVGSSNNELSICHFPYPLTPSLHNLNQIDSDGEYIVSWNPMNNVTVYTLQESITSNFSSVGLSYTTISTSVAISGKLNATYYYRVKASNDYGNSAWSEVKSIKVVHLPGSPVIEPVSSPDVDGNYTIAWSKIEDAKNYTLEESIYSNFNLSTIIYAGSNTSFNLSDKPDGIYYYRIKAINEGGESSWNTTSVTVLHLPEVPVISVIVASDNYGNYTIFWSEIVNADYYILEESQDYYFSSPNVVYTGIENSTNIVNKPNGTYYYRVQAVNDAGYSNWSNIQNITILPANHFDMKIIWPIVIIIVFSSAIIYFLWKRKRKQPEPEMEKKNAN